MKRLGVILTTLIVVFLHTSSVAQNADHKTLVIKNKKSNKVVLCQEGFPVVIKINSETPKTYKGDLLFENDSTLNLNGNNVLITSVESIRFTKKTAKAASRIFFGISAASFIGTVILFKGVSNQSYLFDVFLMLVGSVVTFSISVATLVAGVGMRFKKYYSAEKYTISIRSLKSVNEF
ncbi:MAG: hypothetical protein AB8B74_05260 [Crocinitomicaceae bacterium]